MTNQSEVTTIALLPLLKTPPTDWIVQGISVRISPSNKSVVTLDLQFYIKCMQLSSRKDVSDQFVFLMGELHVVFAIF